MTKFNIVPYLHIDGVIPFPDSSIMQIWDRMRAEHTAEKVFFDGTITTREQFLAKVKRPDNLFFIAIDGDALAGFFWLDNFAQRRAHIHFCVMRDYWGSDGKALGALSLNVVRDMRDPAGRPLFHMLAGVTEASNTLAIRYAKSLGMTKCGYLPGYLFNARLGSSVDAVILALTLGG